MREYNHNRKFKSNLNYKIHWLLTLHLSRVTCQANWERRIKPSSDLSSNTERLSVGKGWTWGRWAVRAPLLNPYNAFCRHGRMCSFFCVLKIPLPWIPENGACRNHNPNLIEIINGKTQYPVRKHTLHKTQHQHLQLPLLSVCSPEPRLAGSLSQRPRSNGALFEHSAALREGWLKH